MDLRQIRYFVTVAEELNFSRAAARLHITQPPLTRQIQQLEEFLGVTLLVRGSRGVSLTASGETFLAEARKLLSLAGQAIKQTQMTERGELGQIAIGVFGSAILSVIPQLLIDFRSRFPGVAIALYTMGKGDQIQALHQGRLTVAFNRFVPRDDELAVVPVWQEPLYIAVHHTHPLVQQASVQLRQFADDPFILFPNLTRPSLADEVVALCRAEGFEPLVAQETSDVLSSIALVATGFGVSLVPRSAINLQLPGIAFLPLAEPQPMVDLSCMYLRGNNSPTLLAFLETVHSFREKHRQGKGLI